jgi:hypothetical protein
MLAPLLEAAIGVEWQRRQQMAGLSTNTLPFSEWTQVIPNTGLCIALVDRAHTVGTPITRFGRPTRLRSWAICRYGRALMAFA